MGKVLDDNGLERLWEKIKSNFLRKTDAASTYLTKNDAIAKYPVQCVVDDSVAPGLIFVTEAPAISSYVQVLGKGGTSIDVDVADNRLDIASPQFEAGTGITIAQSGDDANVYVISATGMSVTIDSALSSTSTNPVQNKVVNTALAAKAALASPTFTGQPKAPTAAVGTSTTQLATTAFVQNALPSAATATGTGSTAVSAGAITQVPLTALTGAVKTNLSISSGGVKCAKAGYVRVSGSTYTSPTVNGSWQGTYVRKGPTWAASSEVASSYFTGNPSGTGISVAPKIISVSAGDVIFLASRISDSGGTVYNGNSATYLTVEYVEQVG